jgi:hypothetical protein
MENQKRDKPRERDTGGEYFPIAFLRDGSVVLVTTIQDDQKDRFGFSSGESSSSLKNRPSQIVPRLAGILK